MQVLLLDRYAIDRWGEKNVFTRQMLYAFKRKQQPRAELYYTLYTL